MSLLDNELDIIGNNDIAIEHWINKCVKLTNRRYGSTGLPYIIKEDNIMFDHSDIEFDGSLPFPREIKNIFCDGNVMIIGHDLNNHIPNFFQLFDNYNVEDYPQPIIGKHICFKKCVGILTGVIMKGFNKLSVSGEDFNGFENCSINGPIQTQFIDLYLNHTNIDSFENICGLKITGYPSIPSINLSISDTPLNNTITCEILSCKKYFRNITYTLDDYLYNIYNRHTSSLLNNLKCIRCKDPITKHYIRFEKKNGRFELETHGGTSIYERYPSPFEFCKINGFNNFY